MTDFLDFLRFINTRLYDEKMRAWSLLRMSANVQQFSWRVYECGDSEILQDARKKPTTMAIPDMIPAGMFPGDSAHTPPEGIEIKASRYTKGWQGHNARIRG